MTELKTNKVNKRDHSIKVPRIYKLASIIYQKVKDGGGSPKNLVYDAKHPNKKGIYAIVLTTIQKDAQIDYILKKSQFLTKESRIHVPLAKVLIAELLWGKKSLPPESKPLKTVLGYEQIFHAHANDMPDDDVDPRAKVITKPRYVRINTLKATINEVIDGFRDEGWILRRYMGDNYAEFLDVVNNLGESEFMVDFHVKDLLLFPPRTQFHKHVAYRCGKIILQDKASCLPVALLNPPAGSHVLDMCAAPGMKTTQLAALLENSGKLYAVEKDAERIETLRWIVQSAGATCVETVFKDVLTVDSKILTDVEYILVDPSCSGSGITDRFEVKPSAPSRFEKLSGFQIMVLKHAMRAFPKVKRIVYSTCSILPEENEAVVQDVMNSNSSFKLLNAKELLPSWHNFGSEDYEVGPLCIYARPDHDLTHGFFVAVFERLQEGETNQFLKRELSENVGKPAKNKKTKSEDTHLQETNNNQAIEEINEDKDKKQKKKKNDKTKENNLGEDCLQENVDETIEKSKKKKKAKTEDTCLQETNDIQVVDNITDKKSKKNKKQQNNNVVVEKKSKKKKQKSEETDQTTETTVEKKKKKKKRSSNATKEEISTKKTKKSNNM